VPRGKSFSASNPSIELAKYGEEGDKDRIKPEPRFGPLEPGEYDIVLSGSFGSFGGLEILRQPVTLAGGENAAAAVVPRLNTLTVTLPQGVTSRFIMIRPKGSAQQRGPTMPDFKDGRSVIDLLPDGEWVLFDGVGEIVVRAPGPAEVVFEPRHYDALRVKCQAGAWIEQLGFRNDDVVVEIDGQALKDMESAWALVTLSISKEKTSWKVVRAGAEIELAFDGRDLAKLRDPKSINDPHLVAGYR
jgi:hypothetical protein